MKSKKRSFYICVFLVHCWFVFSPVMAEPKILAENLRVILAPSVAKNTAIYGVIKNTGNEADTLIKINSNAGMVMLHRTVVNSDHTQMKLVENYVIHPNSKLPLKPMSYHLMLMRLDHNIVKKNGHVTITLEFQKQGKLNFIIPVLSE